MTREIRCYPLVVSRRRTMGMLLPVIFLILFLAVLGFLLTPISLRFEFIHRYMSIKWKGISFERKFREWKAREPGKKTEGNVGEEGCHLCDAS